MNKILACISVYNKSTNELNRCINSIPESYDIRIDIDGGWDSSGLIIDNPKVTKIVNHQLNQGLGRLRNLQIDEIPDDITHIQFIDADDYLENDTIFDEHSDYDLIISKVKLITDKGVFIEDRNLRVLDNELESFFVIPSIIFNKRVFKNSGLRFFESKSVFEDVLFSLELSSMFKDLVVIPIYAPYYTYVIKDGTLSTSDTPNLVRSTILLLEDLRQFSLLNEPRYYCRYVEEARRLIDYGYSDLANYYLKLYKL